MANIDKHTIVITISLSLSPMAISYSFITISYSFINDGVKSIVER